MLSLLTGLLLLLLLLLLPLLSDTTSSPGLPPPLTPPPSLDLSPPLLLFSASSFDPAALPVSAPIWEQVCARSCRGDLPVFSCWKKEEEKMF